MPSLRVTGKAFNNPIRTKQARSSVSCESALDPESNIASMSTCPMHIYVEGVYTPI